MYVSENDSNDKMLLFPVELFFPTKLFLVQFKKNNGRKCHHHGTKRATGAILRKNKTLISPK